MAVSNILGHVNDLDDRVGSRLACSSAGGADDGYATPKTRNAQLDQTKLWVNTDALKKARLKAVNKQPDFE